jgi:DNA-binding protein HU-beta
MSLFGRNVTYKYTIAHKMVKEMEADVNRYRNWYLNIEDTISYIDDVLDAIQHELEEGNDVKLLGFGQFRIQTRKAREGRNPKTGEPLSIPETNYISFRSGDFLRRAVNFDKRVDVSDN